MDEETFLHTIKYSPWTYFSDSCEEDENSFHGGGILKKMSDPNHLRDVGDGTSNLHLYHSRKCLHDWNTQDHTFICEKGRN